MTALSGLATDPL